MGRKVAGIGSNSSDAGLPDLHTTKATKNVDESEGLWSVDGTADMVVSDEDAGMGTYLKGNMMLTVSALVRSNDHNSSHALKLH